jgi:hypothetical protein
VQNQDSEGSDEIVAHASTAKGRPRGHKNFTAAEKMALLDIIEQRHPHGTLQWNEVAIALEGKTGSTRSGSSCRKRFHEWSNSKGGSYSFELFSIAIS